MKRILTAMLICLCGCSTVSEPAGGSRAHLDSITIPHLELRDVEFLDAVDAIRYAGAFHDPRRLQGKPHGFSIIVKFDRFDETVASAPGDNARAATDSFPNDPFANMPPAIEYSYPTVSILVKNQSMSELLGDLCSQAGAEFRIIKKGTILIQPRKDGQHQGAR